MTEDARPYKESAVGLKNCPACDGGGIGWVDSSYTFHFVCNGCGHSGPSDDGWGIEEARRRWDTGVGDETRI